MSMEDKQVIDMANRAGERRERAENRMRDHLSAVEGEREWSRRARKFRRRMILQAMIPTLLCILSAFAILAIMVNGSIAAADAPYAAAIIFLCGTAGGMTMRSAMGW